MQDHQSAVENGLADVDDLPGFAAATEDRMRSVMGGGSISSSLFVGETLTDVILDGRKAWATRLERGRERDDIGFVRKRDAWKI